MKRITEYFIILVLGLFQISTYAQSESSNFKVAPSLDASFPVFLGGRISLIVDNTYEIGFGAGIVPEPFYSVIGYAAASLSGNDSYDDVINAAFSNNQMYRFNFQYNFTGLAGWRLGLAGSLLNSTGKAEIDQVLGAATGRDYSNLKSLLALAGRSSQVDMDSELEIIEIYGGYLWDLSPRISVEALGGIAKVFTSQIKLKTGLPVFESSVAGSSLLRSSESDLDKIVEDYGITPYIGASLKLKF